MRKVFLVFLALIIGLSIFVIAAGQKGEEGEGQFEIVMVVKLEGVAWFDNMRLGIEEFNNAYEDVNAYQIGADTADPAA